MMVLSKAAEDRKQRILLRREQARQEINERQRLATFEEDRSSIVDAEQESESETGNSDEEEPQPDKKPKLDIPDAKTIVSNVFRFLNEEYKFLKIRNGNEPWVHQLATIRQRTAEATGFSKDTVRKIVREGRERIAGRRQREWVAQRTTVATESDQLNNEETTSGEESCINLS